jgi:hypothetical protein
MSERKKLKRQVLGTFSIQRRRRHFTCDTVRRCTVEIELLRVLTEIVRHNVERQKQTPWAS